MQDNSVVLNWPPEEIELSEKRLIELRDLIERKVPGEEGDESDYVIPELSRFLVVRSASHLEIVVHQCFLHYVERHCREIMVPYVQQTHTPWEQAKPSRLKELLGKISPELKDGFSLFLSEDNLCENLGSLINKRGKIAHGANETVTFRVALGHCSHAMTCASWFIDTFAPGGEADQIAHR